MDKTNMTQYWRTGLAKRVLDEFNRFGPLPPGPFANTTRASEISTWMGKTEREREDRHTHNEVWRDEVERERARAWKKWGRRIVLARSLRTIIQRERERSAISSLALSLFSVELESHQPTSPIQRTRPLKKKRVLAARSPILVAYAVGVHKTQVRKVCKNTWGCDLGLTMAAFCQDLQIMRLLRPLRTSALIFYLNRIEYMVIW